MNFFCSLLVMSGILQYRDFRLCKQFDLVKVFSFHSWVPPMIALHTCLMDKTPEICSTPFKNSSLSSFAQTYKGTGHLLGMYSFTSIYLLNYLNIFLLRIYYCSIFARRQKITQCIVSTIIEVQIISAGCQNLHLIETFSLLESH